MHFNDFHSAEKYVNGGFYMRSQKIISALFMFVLCLLFAGCMAQEPSDAPSSDVPAAANTQSSAEASNAETTESTAKATEASTSAKTTETTKATKKDEPAEPAELTYLRAMLKENKATVGVAYIDFLPDAEEISKNAVAYDCSTNGIFNEYPFLARSKIALNRGHEMYALVPASKTAVITIYESGIDDEGNIKDVRSNVLYKGKAGEPVVIICNIHEAFSNVLISVKDGKKKVEFRPVISLENGRDIVLTDGCYDFTYRDIRAYSTEASQYLSENIDEIKNGIENGLTLRYRNEVFMYNHFTIKYELGSYNDDYEFEVVREYLVDDYYTMAFYQPEDGEETVGWRIVGKGFDYHNYTPEDVDD